MVRLFEKCTKVPTECENYTKELFHWADTALYGLVWYPKSHSPALTCFSATCLVQLHATNLESHCLSSNPNCVTFRVVLTICSVPPVPHL